VPWSGVIRLRNRLIRGYDTLNFDILWNILTADVPVLATGRPVRLVTTRQTAFRRNASDARPSGANHPLWRLAAQEREKSGRASSNR
jgi:hypothetical protein